MWQWIETLNIDIIDSLIKGSALILFVIISQAIIWFLKFRLRRRYAHQTTDLADMEEAHRVATSYFRRRQMLDVVRAVLLLVSLLVGVLFYNIQAFSFLALALGAVVINQKENINSIIAYFYLLANYQVGDDISIVIGAYDSFGEIVRISLFHTIIAGKDAGGEYNGKRISVPNYQFLLNPTEQQSLRPDTHRLVKMEIAYSPELHGQPFDEFLTGLRAFLNELLPKRTLRQVGSFRGFAGMQYKLDFDSTASGAVMLNLSFISRARDVAERKERIVGYLDDLRA